MAQPEKKKTTLSDRIKVLQAREAAQKAKSDRVKEIKGHQDAIKRLRSKPKK